MTTYIVGDIHGSYFTLMKLLERIRFSDTDKLISVGDLINRGKFSLEVLRFFVNNKNTFSVWGNHDFLLPLSKYAPYVLENESSDMLKIGKDILSKPDGEELLNWLCSQELIIELKEYNAIIVHAGIYPIWSIKEAICFSKEVSKLLSNEDGCRDLMNNLYGDMPDSWSEAKQSQKINYFNRVRFIINSMTRMRLVKPNIEEKASVKLVLNKKSSDKTLVPWFILRDEYILDSKLDLNDGYKIIFGHWAALNGKTDKENYIGLDTGCAWNNHLSIYNCTTNHILQQECIS